MFPINLYQKIKMPVDDLMELIIIEAEKHGVDPEECYGFAAAVLKHLEQLEDKELSEKVDLAINTNSQNSGFPPKLKLIKYPPA